GRAPRGGKGVRGELGAIGGRERLGPPVEREELLEDAHDAGGWDRGPDLNRQRFPVGLIEDVEGPEAAPAIERVVHEVEGPDAVQRRRGHEGLAQPLRDAALRAAGEMEPPRAVPRMQALGVPGAPVEPESVKTLPEAPAPMLPDDGQHRLHHRPIPRRRLCRPPIPCRPRQPDRPARVSNRELVLCDQEFAHLAPRGRRYSFRWRTSLMAAFSSASSAYIRLSLAFSPSSSLMRFSSATVVPAYFDRHRK